MNDTTIPPPAAADAPAGPGARARVPDTSMLPGSEKPPPAALNLLNHAVQGAHEALDRFSDRARPVARQVGEQVSNTEAALQAQTAQWRQTGDEWADSLRGRVRDNPLVAMAAAALLGAVLARLTQNR